MGHCRMPFSDAECVTYQVTMEVASKCPSWESCEIHVNHRSLLTSVWNWASVKQEEQRVVAQVSTTGLIE